MPKLPKKLTEDSYVVVFEDRRGTKRIKRSVYKYMKEDWPDSCFTFMLPGTESPETLLERSLRDGEYTAGVTNHGAIAPEVFEDATVDDFRTISPVSPARCSNLLHSEPIPDCLASNLLNSPITALRLAQVFEQAYNQKKNRFGIAFRDTFYEQLDHLIDPSFGEDPNPWCPKVTRLRAVDWYLAVLARLLRRWREAKHNQTVWESMYPKDVKAIEQAKLHRTELSLVRSANRREEPFPWEQRKAASSTTVRRGCVLSAESLSRLENQRSIRHGAETAGYLVFHELLSRDLLESKAVYCKRCDGIFLLSGNHTDFCSVSCSHRFAKDKRDRRLYLKRVDVAIKSLSSWINTRPSFIGWRAYLEQELDHGKKDIKGPQSRKNPVVGAWILAADSEKESEQWKKPMSRWFNLDVGNTERDSAIRKFEHLYSLIREAQVAS
jgi:hypothetical protein